ncbi:hypothetical protein Tco_1431203 [Tanacetum coccineum]
MAVTAMKHMALNFSKLDKFEGVNFRRWQKKMNFLLSSMSVVCNIPYFQVLGIMPPRRFKKKSVRKIVEKRVAKAIEKYEKTRADSNNTGGSGSTNTGGTVLPEMHDFV